MKRGLGIYAAAIFAFLHLPLVTLAVFSFNSSRFTVWEGFSLKWYEATFRDPQLAEGTWNSIVIALSYNKLGTARLQNCKFWMDAGELQTSGDMAEFKLARGPSTRALPVTFRLGVLRAQSSPNVTVTLSCDKASSAAMPLDLRIATDKP